MTMEEGIAHLFLISKHKTVLKQKVEKSVTKVNKGFTNKHTASKNKFFDQCVSAFEKAFTGDNQSHYDKVNCIILGSPGFVAENFSKYLKDAAEKKQSSFLKDVCCKTIVSHCSSGYKHSLGELMSNQNVTAKISSMSCANETAALDKFFEMLAVCEDKVTYGPKSV